MCKDDFEDLFAYDFGDLFEELYIAMNIGFVDIRSQLSDLDERVRELQADVRRMNEAVKEGKAMDKILRKQ